MSTDSNDLVSGVLTRLDMIEKMANQARFDPTRIHVDDPEDGPHIRWHDPDAVLRLCRAHRQIVERYETARKVPDELMAKRAHGADVLIADAVTKALEADLRSLAVGLGVLEETSNDE